MERMKSLLTLAAFALLAGCSSTSVETKTEPKPEPEPRTGRLALQSTFPSARGWAPDCEPLMARNLHLQSRPAGEGKAYAWEVTYVSPRSGSQRTFVWSSIEGEGLNEGVFGGPPQSWRAGSQPTIAMSALKIDTPEALAAASENAKSYLDKAGDKPPVTYMLEYVPRYGTPVWRVMWGLTPGTSEFTVFVDAGTGKVLGRG